MSSNSPISTTEIQDLFKDSTDILFTLIDAFGKTITANKACSKKLNRKSSENSSHNFFENCGEIFSQNKIEKIKNVIKTHKTIVFNSTIENNIYKFIVTPHLSSKKSLEFITIIGILIKSEEDTIVELKTTINSLNKQNDDLLELIEKLSLKNIEVEKINDYLTKELKKKDKFFSILSHDLRGQMGNMINSSDLLVHSFDDLDFTDIRSILRMLNKSIRKNYTLLDNLLLWASFERGKIQPKMERIKVYEAINNSLEDLQASMEKKAIIIHNNISNDIYVEADRKYLEIVFTNIISNSIKFSNPESEIEIEFKQNDGNFVEIIVIDHGIGFDEETLNNLFQIDHIHSNYGTEKETGSGMGLLIAERILTSMHGELKIITNIGEGTSASIYLKKP
ncbi:MAG: HAMP domain-containing sensor histidine kinase [Bacteroidota bacterium]